MSFCAFSRLHAALATSIILLPVCCLVAQEIDPVTILHTEASTESLNGGELDTVAGDCCAACNCTRSACCCGEYVDWTTVPESIRPLPRPGNFLIRPTGYGYYSLWDQLTNAPRDNPPQSGYPPFALMAPSFFDADFRYVESLGYDERTLVESLKRIPLTDCLTFSTGGHVWARYMNEHNSRLTQTDNSYTLARVRAFGDLMYGDRVRVFGEYIWADAFSEELAPLPIDVNRGDVLNLFVDLNLLDYNGKPVFARIGRQEFLFGSQRLVSTLDWANTRRTFDGVRLFRTGEQWDVDLFYSAFVPPNPSGLDQLNDSLEFGGAWTTYRPQRGHFLDFYYLFFDNTNNVIQQRIVRAPREVHTIGTRYAGDRNGYLWDYELALQFGKQNRQDLLAGAATAGLGRHLRNVTWAPTIWVYYDYASGDADPTSGDAHTFSQLFPFGHYYLGWIDQVARQNIHDVNAHLLFHPEPWLTVWLQYHHFWLNHSRDALYNAGGIAIRRDATGAAGTNVGDEIDIVLNFHLRRYSDILAGYSKLFGGGFLESTSGANTAADAELFYLMFQQRW